MEEKKNNNFIWLILIIVITFGLVSYMIFDKVILKDKENTTTITPTKNPESTNDDKAVAYCKNNIDFIHKKIIELEKNSFTAKYFPENLEIPEKEMIACERSLLDDNKYYFTLEFDDSEAHYFYDIQENKMFAESSYFDTAYQLQAFLYAKDLVSKDRDIYQQKHSDFTLGTYEDRNYVDGDTYILSICEYYGEGEPCQIHYYDYEINFKDKTFKKINIEVE